MLFYLSLFPVSAFLFFFITYPEIQQSKPSIYYILILIYLSVYNYLFSIFVSIRLYTLGCFCLNNQIFIFFWNSQTFFVCVFVPHISLYIIPFYYFFVKCSLNIFNCLVFYFHSSHFCSFFPFFAFFSKNLLIIILLNLFIINF